MQKEIIAALKAAKAYKPRNQGDETEVALVVGMLSDCLAHAGQLDELADAWHRAQRIAQAQNELRAAETA